MPSVAASLFWISIVAVVAPIVAGLVPRRLVPEVVILLGLGTLIGPFGLELAIEGPTHRAAERTGPGHAVPPRRVRDRPGGADRTGRATSGADLAGVSGPGLRSLGLAGRSGGGRRRGGPGHRPDVDRPGHPAADPQGRRHDHGTGGRIGAAPRCVRRARAGRGDGDAARHPGRRGPRCLVLLAFAVVALAADPPIAAPARRHLVVAGAHPPWCGVDEPDPRTADSPAPGHTRRRGVRARPRRRARCVRGRLHPPAGPPRRRREVRGASSRASPSDC